MAKIANSINIENFRGIKSLNINDFENLNMFIGDNGTNKTSILEALNYAFSPSFLSGRIKHTDFYEGTDGPIKIEVKFERSFKVKLPDGYATQEVECNKISLTIAKRQRKSPGKVLSDLVTIEHIVLPISKPREDAEGNLKWSVKRKKGSDFEFGKRLLSFNIFESEEIPRAFYFNKERDKQLYKGFNTSFSAVTDDFNWRFQKKISDPQLSNTDDNLFNHISNVENKIVELAEVDKHEVKKELDKRIESFGLDIIDFSFIDRATPFDQLFISKNFKKLNIPVKYLGSGIEMIYSLLFLDTLASLSREKLIILIDEPELHLHPNLQEKLANYLFNLSQDEKYQIFFTTHSPIFFKTLVNKSNVKSMIARKDNSDCPIYQQKNSISPWGPTWGEINYFAYNYPTLEFHNELYGYLQEITEKLSSEDLDEYLNNEYHVPKDKKWIPERNGIAQTEKKVTLMTFIRHKIHHPENRTMQPENYSHEELRESISKMIEIINQEKNK